MDFIQRASFVMLASVVLGAALPASASPLDDLHSLVGSWRCTFVGGKMHLAYDATYAYEPRGHALREIASWVGGGDEELIAYEPQHHVWAVDVIDDQGTTTVMRGTAGNASHFAYRSVYPDTSIAVKFDRISATKYLLHGTVRSGEKTMATADTCLRDGAR